MADERRRILIVDPPFLRLYKPSYSSSIYPLALGYLAGAVRKNTKWQVVTYNADFCPEGEGFQLTSLVAGFDAYRRALQDLDSPVWQEIRAVMIRYRPHVVGISTKSQNYAAACNVARIAKALDPAIVTVMGGPHPSMAKAKALQCADIDIGVIGEGERTLVELLGAIEESRDLSSIRGIMFNRDGETVLTPPREFIDDLDSLDFPFACAADTFHDFDKYPKSAFRYIFAIRGCPYGCTFCGSKNIWSRRVRFRSPENVAREIKNLADHGVYSPHFHDDTFGVSREYIRQLCKAIRDICPDAKWSCEIHANLVDDSTVEAMRAAGCFMIQMGVESGNDAILRNIKKNITSERARTAAETIKRNGIALQTFFMVGFPDETLESLEDTRRAMLELDPDTIVYSIFTPYPGTALFDELMAAGVIDETFDAGLYNHQSPNNHFCPAIPRDVFRRAASDIERIVDGFNNTTMVRLAIRTHIKYGLPLELFEVGPGKVVAGHGFNIQPNGDSAVWAVTKHATNATVLCLGNVALPTAVHRGGDFVTAIVPARLYDKPGHYPLCLLDTVTKIRSNEKIFEVVARPDYT